MFEFVLITSRIADLIVLSMSMLPGKAVALRDIQTRIEPKGRFIYLIMLMAPWGHVRDRSHYFLFYCPLASRVPAIPGIL